MKGTSWHERVIWILDLLYRLPNRQFRCGLGFFVSVASLFILVFLKNYCIFIYNTHVDFSFPLPYKPLSYFDCFFYNIISSCCFVDIISLSLSTLIVFFAVLVFWKYLFYFYLTSRITKRRNERGRGREIFDLLVYLVHSPDGLNGWNWANLKPGASF